MKNKSSLDQSVLMGTLLIVAGIIILAANLLNVQFDGSYWPLYIIGSGLFLFWAAHWGDPSTSISWLAGAGAVLSTIGLLLAFMEWVDHYESWAYAWTLLPAAAVAGHMYANRFDPTNWAHKNGAKIIRGLIVAFIVLAIIFEGFIFNGYGRWWPVLLIFLGLYLLVSSRR